MGIGNSTWATILTVVTGLNEGSRSGKGKGSLLVLRLLWATHL